MTSMFDLPTKSKLPKIIGMIGHNLYVFINDDFKLDIYSLNVFLNNSWKLKWSFEFNEVAYLTATVKRNEACIYFLFTGCYKEEMNYSLDILRLDLNQSEYTKYKSSNALSVFELIELYNVHFETDTLCCGENDLYVYDRGMVSGSIPFTRFILDHENKTFSGRAEPIPADDPAIRPTIFGSLINPDQKQFVKLADQNALRVFNKDLAKWVEFSQTRDDSDLYLNDLITRHTGIGVTYNQEHTRFAIVSSPIKLVAGDNTCLLVYKVCKKVHFFRIIFDEEKQQFKLKRVGRINHAIPQGYMYCDRDQLIVLASPSYHIPLRVLTLKEIAFKEAQIMFEGAEDDSELRKLCGITHDNPLI